MARKKTMKKVKAEEEAAQVPQEPVEPEPAPETAPAAAEPHKVHHRKAEHKKEAPKKEAPRKEEGTFLKTVAVVVLLVLAVSLAYYFLTASGTLFNTGPEVDVETFKSTFASSELVYIVMDVRGVRDSTVINNVLQCGVDFAGSTGMGGKDVVYFSLANDGCTAPDGAHPIEDCTSQLKDGITIYVKEGPGGAKYYSNGMIVTVGKDYSFGTCGIHKA